MISDPQDPPGGASAPPAGRRFRCTRCGVCCLGKGGIHLTSKEIGEISGFLALDEGLFKSRYLEPSKEKGLDVKSRAEAFNPCVFLEASLCLIEPVKPKVCRSWPFIESVLRSESAFCEAESACPGLKNISYGEMLTEYQERQKRG